MNLKPICCLNTRVHFSYKMPICALFLFKSIWVYVYKIMIILSEWLFMENETKWGDALLFNVIKLFSTTSHKWKVLNYNYTTFTYSICAIYLVFTLININNKNKVDTNINYIMTFVVCRPESKQFNRLCVTTLGHLHNEACVSLILISYNLYSQSLLHACQIKLSNCSKFVEESVNNIY